MRYKQSPLYLWCLIGCDNSACVLYDNVQTWGIYVGVLRLLYAAEAHCSDAPSEKEI